MFVGEREIVKQIDKKTERKSKRKREKERQRGDVNLFTLPFHGGGATEGCDGAGRAHLAGAVHAATVRQTLSPNLPTYLPTYLPPSLSSIYMNFYDFGRGEATAVLIFYLCTYLTYMHMYI